MLKTISTQRRSLSRFRNTGSQLQIPHLKLNTVLNFGDQAHSYIIERFGKYNRTKGSGIFFTLPYLETIKCVDMRQLVLDVDKLSSFTGDNVSVHVEARLYFTVKNAEDVCYKVAQVIDALVAQSQSALRTAIGKNDLDHLLKDRNSINVSVCKDLEVAGGTMGYRCSSI